MDGDLADHVRGRAKAVEAEPVRVARQSQRPIADQPAAQQRRRLLVRKLVREWQAEALVGHGQLGIAAIDVAAGEARVDTQILAAAGAVVALTVGEAKPRNPHPAIILGQPDDLVAQHDREPGRLDLRITEVKVSPANRTCGDA